jgi:alpha-beta hydrolase superfamily lysophospholipase
LRSEFERYDIFPETDLVGHSCGGGFFVRWLSKHLEVKVGNVVLWHLGLILKENIPKILDTQFAYARIVIVDTLFS